MQGVQPLPQQASSSGAGGGSGIGSNIGGARSVMAQASREFNWNLPMPTIAKIWRAGCIIRSQFLDEITTAFTKDPPSLLLATAFLPVLTVVIGSIAHLVRLVRAGFIEALNSDYVERARLAGASDARLVLRHALPASVIPALNSAALYAAGLLSGIIVVEKVFAYPGLGLVLINAVEKREVAVVQAVSLIAAVIVISMNLLADAAVMALDPRARSR